MAIRGYGSCCAFIRLTVGIVRLALVASVDRLLEGADRVQRPLPS